MTDGDRRTVLVTGASGMLGRALLPRLLADGARVRALVRSPERLRQALGPAAERVDLRAGDLTEPASLARCCEGADVVLHCASPSLDSAASGAAAQVFQRVIVEGTAALATEAERAGVRRFVHVSSTAAMGSPRQPVVDETTACRPETAYQRAKREAELRLLERAGAGAPEVVIVRPCLIAGPGKRGGELLQLFRLCRRGLFPVVGGQLAVQKPLVDVDDVVQALLLAADRGRPGAIYLVHSDGGHTLGEILRAAGDLVGRPRPWVNVPLPAARLAARVLPHLAGLLRRPAPLTPQRLQLFLTDRRIDITRARQELGFAPRHREARGMLERTWRWYVESGQLRP